MNASKPINWSGWLTFGGVLLLWEIASRVSLWMQSYIPPVSQILSSLMALVITGDIAVHLLISLGRFVAGYVIAAVMAVTLGVILGYLRLLHSFLHTVIEFLRPMPSVAIIPVALLFLGIGDSMIIAVTVYASLWPILVNTIEGVRYVDPLLIDTGRTFGLGRWQILRRIILPAASPFIVTGLRISLAIALILVTTAEMIAGSQGLGFFVLDEERSLRTANMYAGVFVVAVLGYLLNRIFLAWESWAMKWRAGMRATEAI
jgi:ABC-type nitrate/sulfonate/bicarbonate transport system permease component